MENLILLWPIIGIVCAFASTPKWMFEHSPSGVFLAIFCGAVVGPFGLLWFLTRDGSDGVR